MVTVNQVISRLPNKGKVLDVGCFNGFVLDKIMDRKLNLSLYGVDASLECVKFCKSKGHNVLQADLEKTLPYDDGHFDVIIGLEVIEHLADTDFFIKELKRILKDNGKIILTTPNALSLPRRVMTLFGINPFYEASFSFPPGMAGHLRFYTPQLLKDFMKFHNLKVIYLGSDVINFSHSGKIYSEFLAKIFPNLGRGIIIEVKKS